MKKYILLLALLLIYPAVSYGAGSCMGGPTGGATSATLGLTTVATGASQAMVADYVYYCEIGTMTEAGTLDSVHFYDAREAASTGLILGVYSGSTTVPSARVFQSVGASFPAGLVWHSKDAGGETLVSGTTYFVAMQSDASGDAYYQYNNSVDRQVTYEALAYSSGMPATPTPVSSVNRECSAYITYTPN